MHLRIPSPQQGPHITGTQEIPWFLKGRRKELGQQANQVLPRPFLLDAVARPHLDSVCSSVLAAYPPFSISILTLVPLALPPLYGSFEATD